MSSIVRFNPKSQVYVGNGRDGRFEPRDNFRQGIISYQNEKLSGLQVISQSPLKPAVCIKIIE